MIPMPLRFALFVAVAAVVIGGGHLMLYRRLVRDLTTDLRLRALGALGLLVLGLLVLAARPLHQAFPGPLTEALGVVAFGWMGVAMYLLLILAAVVVLRWLAERLPGQRGPAADPARRRLLSRAVAGGTLLATGGVSGYGAWRAFHPPELSEVAVRLPGLPKALDGFSIVQLTDIHVGAVIERRFLEELVRRANALRPDVVAITGDLVDGSVEVLGRSVAALGKLRPRHGRYFVNGNHEYYSGDLAWNDFLERVGVRVLRNKRVSIGEGSASFDLVGVDDWSARRLGRGYDLERALDGRDPERAAVLLAHQPENFEEAARRGVGLQLSGHTHGGQIFPFTELVGLRWRHVAGLYAEHGSHLYVSRGCGFWGPPMRVGSPPELVRIVLVA
jgi:uncharacterized protein